MTVLALNALYTGMAPALFWGLNMPGWSALIVAVLFGVVIGRGLWNVQRHPVGIVIAIYLATVICWVWPPLRFLAPVAPGIAWLVMAGVPNVLIIVRTFALAIAISSTFQLWGQVRERSEKQTTWPAPGFADSWPALSPLLDWVVRQTPENAILAGNLDPLYFLYTKRQAVRAFSADAYALYYDQRGRKPLGTVEDFRHRLRTIGADYLIMTPGEGFGESRFLRDQVAELVSTYPGSLSVAAGSETSGYVVYRIDRSTLTIPIRHVP
jgi:hypothetical protein